MLIIAPTILGMVGGRFSLLSSPEDLPIKSLHSRHTTAMIPRQSFRFSQVWLFLVGLVSWLAPGSGGSRTASAFSCSSSSNNPSTVTRRHASCNEYTHNADQRALLFWPTRLPHWKMKFKKTRNHPHHHQQHQYQHRHCPP
jgi:hypothetical protein